MVNKYIAKWSLISSILLFVAAIVSYIFADATVGLIMLLLGFMLLAEFCYLNIMKSELKKKNHKKMRKQRIKVRVRSDE